MSSEPKRIQVSKIMRTHAESGAEVVEMWSVDTRLKYPELRLFDLSALLAVGINPNGLSEDEKVYVRLWATYEESDKLNQHGNPYKDVQFLEPIAGQGSDTEPALDLSAVVQELRAIRVLIELALFNGAESPDGAEARLAELAAPAESEPPEESHDTPAPDGPVINDAQARQHFYALAGPAIKAEKINPVLVNELSQAGALKSWRDALAKLKAALA